MFWSNRAIWVCFRRIVCKWYHRPKWLR